MPKPKYSFKDKTRSRKIEHVEATQKEIAKELKHGNNLQYLALTIAKEVGATIYSGNTWEDRDGKKRTNLYLTEETVNKILEVL